MRVRKVCLCEIRMPLSAPFETSFDRTTERHILLVEADVDGVSGCGEVTRWQRKTMHVSTQARPAPVEQVSSCALRKCHSAFSTPWNLVTF